jgi:hypothetical protein
MRKLGRLLGVSVLLLATSGCTTVIVKDPEVPSQPQGGTCETAHANLEKLGKQEQREGCGIDLSKFVQNCHDREKFDASRGRTLPLDCITSAPTCKEARLCTS